MICEITRRVCIEEIQLLKLPKGFTHVLNQGVWKASRALSEKRR